MATFHWHVGSGDWKTAGNWNPSGPPTSTDDAVIDAAGTYTVTTSQNESINNLTLVSTATLLDRYLGRNVDFVRVCGGVTRLLGQRLGRGNRDRQ
jgi:hypothetical protein